MLVNVPSLVSPPQLASYFWIFVIFSLDQDEFCTFMQLEYAEKEDSYLRSKEVRKNTGIFFCKIKVVARRNL